MKNYIVIAAIFSFIFTSVNASEVQILFTSDLHSFFESSLEDSSIGGYATTKTMITKLRKSAKDRGLETLYFDIGDFSEGNLYYMADGGRASFKMMKLMNPDALVMGNHEWLMGTIELMKILKDVDIDNTKLLAANVTFSPPVDIFMSSYLSSYKIFEVGGKKIGVVGVTSQDLLYTWRIEYGDVSSPRKVADSIAKELKKSGLADVVIALAHTGLSYDQKMAKDSKYIDMIIGGHSHDLLKKPLYVENKKDRMIPIVHTGEFGKYLGRFVLEIDENNTLKVNEYGPLTVDKTSYLEDEEISAYIKQARESLDDLYSEEWLNEVLGFAEVPLEAPLETLTPWTSLITTSIKEYGEADCSFFSPGFVDASYGTGPVTREMVANAMPRFFSIDKKFGWNLWRVKVKGIWLKFVIKAILKWQPPVSVSGISFKVIAKDGSGDDVIWSYGGSSREIHKINGFFDFGKDIKIKEIKIGGKKIKWGNHYTVSLPEGIVLGALGISSKLGYLFKDITKLETTLWEAVSKKIQDVKVIK